MSVSGPNTQTNQTAQNWSNQSTATNVSIANQQTQNTEESSEASAEGKIASQNAQFLGKQLSDLDNAIF